MGCVRKVTGEDVMTEDEFAAWWSEHLQGGVFIDVLRLHLATKLRLKNFRQLALVCGDDTLSDSHWVDAEVVVVIRPYLADTDGDGPNALVQAVANGDIAGVVSLLEMPLEPAEAVDPDR